MSRPSQWLEHTLLNRRDFAALSAGAALGFSDSTAATSQTEATVNTMPSLHIRPRFHRWHVDPVGNEPVIATGDELHDFCRTNGILILIFAGFNTNACILMRNYGTLAMSQRGYEVILLRDCTTGMESRASLPTLGQTNGAILLLEMFGQYSLTSVELLAGLASR